MFNPEYSITDNILKNIANIEYARAIIENTTLLQNWSKQLEKESKTRLIYNSLLREGFNVSEDHVRRIVSKMPNKATEVVKSYITTLTLVDRMAARLDFGEDEIKQLHEFLGGDGEYRRLVVEKKSEPAEILAEINGLIDWSNSLDAKETHPVVLAAIFKARFEYIMPFDDYNGVLSDILVLLMLKIARYDILGFYALEEYFIQTQKQYALLIDDANKQDDYTRWIEYFSEGFSREISTVAEKVKILARDTKIAKAAGEKVRLSERQERIVEYLQDFGMIKNKDFEDLFPSISEDTVLRELKGLIDKGIVAKRGSTKSSRYELS